MAGRFAENCAIYPLYGGDDRGFMLRTAGRQNPNARNPMPGESSSTRDRCSHGLSRRDYLRRGVLAGVAAATASTFGASPARAIEPIVRNKTAKIKFSLAAYSYRALLTGKNPKLTLNDFVDDCAKYGLEGTELTSYYFPEKVTGDFLRELRRRCFQNGLDVSGTAVGNDFCHPAGPKRDAEIEHVKLWIENAAILSAPVIRIFSGNVKSGQTPAEAHQLAVAGIEECCDFAGRHGIMLALENHGGLTENVDGLLALVRDVKSPWFGLNMDTGNFHSADIYGDLARLAPYSVNVQVKVAITPKGQKKQPSDFARLAKLLREGGYRGYVALEFEEAGDPRAESERYLNLLRAAFA
jgi:sugar phosphate isomerase/epimerase